MVMLLNYGLVLLYGILLSVGFAGGCGTAKNRWFIAAFGIMNLGAQVLCWSLRGLTFTMKLYPLISHLPLVLILVFVLKKPCGIAVASVLTAYLCCQLPCFFGSISLCLFNSQLASEIGYTISIVPLFYFLWKYFAKTAHKAMTYSKSSLLLFGGFPLFYYLFDYAATVYSNTLYAGGCYIASESLPTAMAMFYVVFIASYHNEIRRLNDAESLRRVMALQLEQAKKDIDSLQQIEDKTATYRHDMRHHFTMISSYLRIGEAPKAEAYIDCAINDIDNIKPKRYCENISANLIFAAYTEKASRHDVPFLVEANIPATIPITETELCALLSNGLDNAIAAASKCAENKKFVRVTCQPHKEKLLILISNTYEGEIVMKNGLPQATSSGHGYGVKSISIIAERHAGYSSFEVKDGLFLMKVVLPLQAVAHDS